MKMSNSSRKKEYSKTREKGQMALSTVLDIKENINIIEKYVHIYTKKALKNYSKNGEDFYEKIYIKVIYQIIGDILKRCSLNKLGKNIKNDMVGWKHPDYEYVKNRIDEHDEFIVNPFEVEEGVTKCRCGSERVFTYQRQSRSADEPMSTYAKCVKCKVQWVYSG